MRLAAFVLCLVLLPLGLSFADEDDDGPVPGPRPDGPPPERGGRRGGRGGGGMLERMKALDKNGDGKISADEFEGPARFFERLDADGDGFIDEAEITAMAERRRGMGGRGGRGGEGARGGQGRQRGLTPERLDTNRDGKVSRAEYDAFFERADQNGDGLVDRDEWTAAVGGGALRDPAPKVGEQAPKVSAKSLATGEMVDLSAPKRVTVLIFGSHT